MNDSIQFSSINIGNNFSVEFWLLPKSSTGWQHLVSNSYQSTNFGALYFKVDHIEYWQGGSNKVSTPSGGVGWNTWSHIAMTYDGSVVRLYVNGTLSGISAPLTTVFNNAFKFGYAIVASSSYFTGQLDEVALYNRVLPVDEIRAVFLAGIQGKCVP